MVTEVVVDIGRLVRRLSRATPTGIDRVILAYLLELRAQPEIRLTCACAARGRLFRFPESFADRLIDATRARWFDGGGKDASFASGSGRLAALRAAALRVLTGGGMAMRGLAPGTVYLSLDHGGLQPGGIVRRLAQREDIRVVCFLHDLIPLTHPEYVVERSILEHQRRVETISACANLVIANSHYTEEALKAYADRKGLRTPKTVTAHLGVEGHLWEGGRSELPVSARARRPYFAFISTIEARKNHLLLLNVWRQLAERMGPETPRLEIVGRRGWEAEAAFDMLDRCTALRGHVSERADLSDAAMSDLLGNARALLFPSFVEGFGLPLVEALASGVPALAADIPAFREIGAGVPEYLNPVDGLGWAEAICDYADPASQRRARQVRRLEAFRPPTWDDHFQIVVPRILELGAGA
ncbi:glycosyltransferase family 4 protein [Stappia indica]|uniref:glycosyltransferase family 4 protein n=1 Tax=Stappia indica TaxID=538381 RepID=UPI001CD49C08|nr:glycosyltransferase family 1 protein [Stappia indica]MCA1300822.1 glycosyltransferase family 4 protein [Stappia indica]